MRQFLPSRFQWAILVFFSVWVGILHLAAYRFGNVGFTIIGAASAFALGALYTTDEFDKWVDMEDDLSFMGGMP